MSNQNQGDDKTKGFTVDTDFTGVDIPSVTRLLNRKSLKIGASSGPTAAKPAAPAAPSGPPPGKPPMPPPAVKPTPPSPSFEPQAISFEPQAEPDAALAEPLEAPAPLEATPEGIAMEAGPMMGESPESSSSSGISLALDPADSAGGFASEAIAAPEVAVADSASDGIALSLDTGNDDFQLETSESAASSGAAFEAPDSGAIELAGADMSGPGEAGATGSHDIRPARRERRSDARITLWDEQVLNAASDPLALALKTLQQGGALCSAYLALKAPSGPGQLPYFAAIAGQGPRERLRVWTGMKWDPAADASTWNSFVREGVVELSPGEDSPIRSVFGVSSGAGGAGSPEWITLIRIGPANSCTGALVVYSSASLLGPAREAHELLQTPLSAAA